MKTYTISKKEIDRKWYIVDANDIRLGRLASEVAKLLMGKGKLAVTRHMNDGDHVIILNASKISVSGNKKETKIYYKHTGYIGHLKEETLGSLLKRKPESVIEKAISGMLPKNKLRQQMLKNLHVCTGTEHKYEAQNPKVFEIQ